MKSPLRNSAIVTDYKAVLSGIRLAQRFMLGLEPLQSHIAIRLHKCSAGGHRIGLKHR